ncbi:MAG: hypothetical protein JW795_15440 [Chitinivibrionales bacterium]|nr:hypothetical protein [Chitinivibrionales bacterium]
MDKKKDVRCLENTSREWMGAILLGVGLTLFFFWYHYLRGRPYELFTLNKSIAIAGVLQLGVALACGPLCRFGILSANFLRQRRTLGLIAMLMLSSHVVFSIFFLSGKFPWAYYAKYPISLTTSIIAIICLLVVTIFSFRNIALRMKPRTWKTVQRLSWLGLIFGYLHFMLLDKIPNWTKWLNTHEPIYPPGTILPGIVTALVLILFVIDLMRNQKSRDNAAEDTDEYVAYSVERATTTATPKVEEKQASKI